MYAWKKCSIFSNRKILLNYNEILCHTQPFFKSNRMGKVGSQTVSWARRLTHRNSYIVGGCVNWSSHFDKYSKNDVEVYVVQSNSYVISVGFSGGILGGIYKNIWSKFLT